MEKENVLNYANNRNTTSIVDNLVANQEIKYLQRATYFGGHKQYEHKCDVNVVFTSDRILLKELPGNPITRIDIPYDNVFDFGVATKEQLTAGRLILVGILAFALKKKEQYLYIKYKDKLGFEQNPIVGEFSDRDISGTSSRLYSLIAHHKGQ